MTNPDNNGNTPDGGNNNELGSWIAIIACFIFVWPVGLILLLKKLFGSSGRTKVNQFFSSGGFSDEDQRRRNSGVGTTYTGPGAVNPGQTTTYSYRYENGRPVQTGSAPQPGATPTGYTPAAGYNAPAGGYVSQQVQQAVESAQRQAQQAVENAQRQAQQAVENAQRQAQQINEKAQHQARQAAQYAQQQTAYPPRQAWQPQQERQQERQAARQTRQQERQQERQQRQAAQPEASASHITSKAKSEIGKGRAMAISGGIGAAVMALASVTEIIEFLADGTLFTMASLSELVPIGMILSAGLVFLLAGINKIGKARRYGRYLALIGKKQVIPLEPVAKAVGKSYRKTCAEIQDMIDDGYLESAYLDLSKGCLVFSDDGIAIDEEDETPEPEMSDNEMLGKIRAANAAIAQPEISEKITQIEQITIKMLKFVEQRPDKQPQLRGFLQYYLPTTLKLLDAYSQLEAQGFEGENIAAAKKRIEGAMDNLVDGYKKQLDKLFADDMVDITADVAVLEQMLAKDGLSGPELVTPEAGEVKKEKEAEFELRL